MFPSALFGASVAAGAKVDPKTKEPLPLEQQDKRTMTPLDAPDFDRWHTCMVGEARAKLKVPPAELFIAGPVGGEAAET